MPDELLSVCCGAPEHPDVKGMCTRCLKWTSFEKEEPDDPSSASRAAGNPDPNPSVEYLERLSQDALGAKLHDIFPTFYPDRDAGVAALRKELGR